MAEYNVVSSTKRKYTLFEQGRALGFLNYAGWFGFKAEIKLPNNDTFAIETTGFGGRSVEMKSPRNQVLMRLKMNWKGNIVMLTNFDDKEQTYTLKRKGIFSGIYFLMSCDAQPLLNIKAKFQLKKFSYDYTISTEQAFHKTKDAEVLLLTAIYFINYYISVKSAG